MILAVSKSRSVGRFLPGKATFFCLGLLALAAATSRAQVADQTPSHFVFPVTSQLQRDLIPSKADLLVYVDSTKGVTRDEFDIRALQLPELRKKLQPFVKGYPHVHFTVFFPKGVFDLKKPGEKLVELAKEMGFMKATNDGLNVNDNKTWETYSKPFHQKPDKPEEDELVISDGIVKVYPVKTTLSRWLTSNADWVIDLPPVEENQKNISPKIVDSIAAMVKKMKIKPKNRVIFRLEHPSQNIQKQLIINDLREIGKNMEIENVVVMYY